MQPLDRRELRGGGGSIAPLVRLLLSTAGMAKDALEEAPEAAAAPAVAAVAAAAVAAAAVAAAAAPGAAALAFSS